MNSLLGFTDQIMNIQSWSPNNNENTTTSFLGVALAGLGFVGLDNIGGGKEGGKNSEYPMMEKNERDEGTVLKDHSGVGAGVILATTKRLVCAKVRILHRYLYDSFI